MSKQTQDLIGNISFLVTTSNSVLHYKHGRFETILKGKGIYYGLTWDENQVYVFSRNNLARKSGKGLFRWISKLVYPKNRLHTLDRDFHHLKTSTCPTIRDVHQALFVGGRVYVANTYFNRIEIFTAGNYVFQNWTGEDRDVNHINSIWFDQKNAQFLVIENNRGTETTVQFFDQDWKRIDAVNAGKHVHNIYRENQNLYFCNSSAEPQVTSVMCYNLDSGKTEHKYIADSGYLARGMARGNGFFLVGLSRKGNRATRHDYSKTGRVIILDDNFEELLVIDVPNAGQVNEIRLTSEPDLAHNGINFMQQVKPDKHSGKK